MPDAVEMALARLNRTNRASIDGGTVSICPASNPRRACFVGAQHIHSSLLFLKCSLVLVSLALRLELLAALCLANSAHASSADFFGSLESAQLLRQAAIGPSGIGALKALSRTR